MKPMKKIAYLVLTLAFLFVSTIQAYASFDYDNNINSYDMNKLYEELHDAEKMLDILRTRDNLNFDAHTNSSHPCHGTPDHRNCDVATLTKSCGCKAITNYCCCGKKMNTDLYLCSRHQAPYNETENPISFFQAENEHEKLIQTSIDLMYKPHTCHEGKEHKRCYKSPDEIDDCGCERGFYFCCCEKIMGAYEIYCDEHGY